MTIIQAKSENDLTLGRQGENLARQVVFDLSAWEAEYGPGVAELIHQRPGDASPYPVAAVREGGTLVWTLTATDTAVASSYVIDGRCELRWYVGETLVKSKTWRTWVESALSTPSETAPPEPEQGWVDQVVAVGAAAQASADAAKADADRATALAAEVSKKAAQTAQDASDAAKAMEAAQTAQRLAEEAQSAAEAARTAADAAQAAAEQSATDAAGAKQDAETALKSAQDAAAAAAKVLADIRALYQEMQTWAQGVIQDVDNAGRVAVQSVRTAGDAQVQRVTDEGTTQTANAKAQADAAAQSASGAAQSAQNAAESAAVYDDVVTDVNQLKQDIVSFSDTVKTAVKTVVKDKEDAYFFESSEIVRGRVDAYDGSIISSTIQGTFDFDVTEGEVYECIGYYINSKGVLVYGSPKNIISVYATDSSGNRIASACHSYNANLPSYTVAHGVTHIRISCTCSGTYDSTRITSTLPDGVTNKYLRQRKYGNPLRYSGVLNAGDVISLGFEHCWLNSAWMFTGLFDGEFASTKIGGCNNGAIVAPYIEVTADKVNLVSTLGGSFNRTFEHGLTISNDLQIIVEQGNTLYNKTLIVQSNGQRWTCDVTSLRTGEPYYGIGITANCKYSQCTASVSLLNLNKPVWVFGDSWTSLYDNRWVGQAVKLGYDTGWMLDGHSGRTSEEALRALKTLISIAQPKMIVWLMGMNDIDPSDTTPNAMWLSSVQEVLSICDAYDITPVLYTIPCVPASQGAYTGTARNNNAKNDWVTASGYRYVDGVKAMGADREGNWIDGYWQSDTDHAHPSELGARALMIQVFADVPEMLSL